MLKPGSVLFSDRYTLRRPIHRGRAYELWEAHDPFGGPVLVKTWPFGPARPEDEERALWNAELRHLFRLASLPESDEHLVVLRDAGIDWTNQCFAMAMLTPGLSLLETSLADRSSCEWLRDLTSQPLRAELWRGVRRLALGIVQLHQQQMFHRAVSARAIFVDPAGGPSTLRLGGFEWTVRIGEDAPLSDVLRPELEGTFSFESDWYMFGSLVAHLVAAIKPATTAERITADIGDKKQLVVEERALLQGLLARDPNSRLNNGHEVVRRIDEVITTLDEPRRLGPDDYLALVALLGPTRPLTLAITELDPDISALDLERQRSFVEDDLRQPRVVRREGTGRETYIIIGNRLRYLVSEYARDASSPGTWDLAFCGGPTELRYSAGDDDQIALRRVPIRVFTPRALMFDESVVRKSAVSWKSYLPRSATRGTEHDNLQRIHDFFRVTNQIELLMRDAEVFSYEITETRVVDGAEELLLREVPRDRPVADFAKLADGLREFLRQEAEKRDGELVYLGEEDALDLGHEVPRTAFWTVTDVGGDDGVIVLRRPRRPGQAAPPPRGYLRAFGLFGQMSLIRRRKRAIDRLGGHAYLLRAIQQPDFTFLDTGAQLPRRVNPQKVDAAKIAAMQSIWRTRPIFALQGPPGTGKTTLVANLLAQVFQDDPVAQVLVTAQAHAAVDVLREKVTEELSGIANRPLAVRLRRTKGDMTPDPDYVDQVAHRLLAASVEELGKEQERQPLQSRWLEAAKSAMHAIARKDTEGYSKDICGLVERAAGITYATTTAGNLAALADSTQTFDWSIVEEAGKAHGFDLVLPLQSGHRWLLIGDQKQLDPYRYEDFLNGLLRLDTTFDAIQDLPRRAGGLVDLELLLRWSKYDESERASRQQMWLNWLGFFASVHKTCARVKLPSDQDRTAEPGGPVLAAMLSHQHRMHPTIAGLVSAAYYGAEIQSDTYKQDGTPLDRVVHPFVEPPGVARCALLWVDIPWVGEEPLADVAPQDSQSRYTSIIEVEAITSLLRAMKTEHGESLKLAILSPYRRQVGLLNDHLTGLALPPWASAALTEQDGGKRRLAATVDSFQGNQADVVIVSLVRNNCSPRGMGLGFLRNEKRMNVLFSRAERLLVLVGSYDFFVEQLADVPADDTQPLGHWRLAMDYIRSCLADGRALKIEARMLQESQ